MEGIESYATALQTNKVDTTDYGIVALPAAWLGLMLVALGVLSVAAGQMSGMTRPEKRGARLAVAAALALVALLLLAAWPAASRAP